MKFLTLFASLVLAAVPVVAQAAGSNLTKLSDLRSPGEWSFNVTRRVEVPGTNMSIPPKTITKKLCLTRQVIDQPLSEKLKSLTGAAQQKGESCKLTKEDLTGNTLTFAVKCSGKQGRVLISGKRVYKSTQSSNSLVRITTKTNGMPVEIRLNTHAKRIGACKAPAAGK